MKKVATMLAALAVVGVMAAWLSAPAVRCEETPELSVTYYYLPG